MTGISLSLTTLPSHWENFHNAAGLRIPVFFTASALSAYTLALIKGTLRLTRKTVALGFGYAFIVFLGQICLYRTLDGFAEFGKIGMVYPVATGICVVIFSIYSVLFLKERLNSASLAGLLGIAGGIFLLAL